MNNIKATQQTVPNYETATGEIRFNLTNDFMFHAVFEENKPALCKLLGSLLHMPMSEIISVEVKNPIDYGASVTDKKVILDLKLLLNEYRIINIEMQVLDEGDWPERSVVYLCRCYDNVLKGKEYDTILPAHQISIVDYDLPGKEPEFYSTHHLVNDKTGAVYTGNFVLSVLNLKQIDRATDEDKKWQIDQWARLFKASSWEELHMIAAQDTEMTDAAKTLYDKNQDEYARNWALAREMFLFDERCRKAREKKALAELEEARKENAELKKETSKTKNEVSKAKDEASKAKEENERLRALLVANGIDPDA